MSTRQIIVLTGPSGCGKSTVADTAAQKLRASPFVLNTDRYSGWKKNQTISNNIDSYKENIVVIENGGGIFDAPIKHKKKDNACFIDTCTVRGMVVPSELLEFCKKFKNSPERNTDTFHKFSSLDSVRSCWELCNHEEHPCNDAWLDLKDLFHARTRSACLHRVSTGSYKLGYRGPMKIGYFANEDAMVETMRSVTERNFKFQFFLIMWAIARHFPIHTITYNDETHVASFNKC